MKPYQSVTSGPTTSKLYLNAWYVFIVFNDMLYACRKCQEACVYLDCTVESHVFPRNRAETTVNQQQGISMGFLQFQNSIEVPQKTKTRATM